MVSHVYESSYRGKFGAIVNWLVSDAAPDDGRVNEPNDWIVDVRLDEPATMRRYRLRDYRG